MVTLPKNEKGFSVVEVVLVLVIVALIGVVGWLVYKDRHKSTPVAAANSSSKQTNTSSTKSSTSKSVTSGQTSSTTTSVFKIPELGVEVTVPNAIKDIVYKVDPSGSESTGQQTESVTLSTQTLTKLDADCSVNGGAPPLGTLSKTQGQYPSSPTIDNASGALVKQFSNYYIAWNSPQAGCGSASSTMNEANADTNLFSASLRSTIAPIQ